ncbi:hypothetical protein UA08_06409 [Talaromyces atroroseus]|uniref:Major facilitator superfamily (MFS) profile domain-containing protein n=1 Tax=Talaromyces atroroseus TaxID=1441469 RepID=A0A225AT88_TALAT|nr:hypothetical protein UA08_06409 [Talaromyces atroroseus]OKL58166.1 hypothetical protein UA08_06409 [Talaromyces atroroseus]
MADIEKTNSNYRPRIDIASPMILSKLGHELPRSKPESDNKKSWVVKFDEGDPDNPKNFKTSYKVFLTFQMSMLALSGSLGSSIVSPGQSKIESQLNVGAEVATLTLSLFVLGWAFGPMIWASISETYGRKWGMLPAVFAYGLFSIGSATSKNIASVLVTRFLGGIFASAPISNVPAALGDMFTPRTRGTAMTFVSLCIVGGPTIGPIIGAALTVNSHLRWRWTEYLDAIFVFSIFALALLALPETYAPVLLKRKAERLRNQTGEQRYWHPHEKERINLNNILTKHLSRPIRLVYFTLEAFPIVFNDQRGYSLLVSTLPFLGVFVGVCSALVVNLGNQPRYAQAVEKNNGKPVPEARLPPMIIGGVFLVGGLFWFGWTANPKYSWALPVVAGGFIGAGFNIVFQQCLNFLVDMYGVFAASAVSANTMLRSLIACGLPLAARPMFDNLGVGPGCSLLGGIAVLALPVPLLLLKYAPSLRRRSRFVS